MPSAGSNHTGGMEAWRTYTPDGRILEVEYAAGEWVALCDGIRAVGPNARDTIAAAVGPETASIGTAAPMIEAWVAANAARLEAEAR